MLQPAFVFRFFAYVRSRTRALYNKQIILRSGNSSFANSSSVQFLYLSCTNLHNVDGVVRDVYLSNRRYNITFHQFH